MKHLTPTRIVTFILAALTLGAFLAYSTGYRFNAPAPPERIYDAPPENALRVLFIGNSHTFVHDVPGMLQRLGEANNTPIWVEDLTIGGSDLGHHLQMPATETTIRNGSWDFVILQEHSLLPALQPDTYLQSLHTLASTIHNADATPVIYATWSRNADDSYFANQPYFASPHHLQNALDASFAKGAHQNNAMIAPVSTAWNHYLHQNPNERLHAPDGNHANPAGAYLAACVFFRTLKNTPCNGNTYHPKTITQATALQLQRAADASPRQWHTRWQ